jgi:hypothetical protein
MMTSKASQVDPSASTFARTRSRKEARDGGTIGEDSFRHATSVCGPFPCVKGVVPLS